MQSRENVISTNWEEALYKYVTGIVTNKGQKLMTINGMPNHVHILISMSASITVADLARDIKSNSAKYVNENNMFLGRFSWQEGYGAFSVSPSQVSKVATYIENQKEHHKAMTFKDEYLELLKRSEVDYKEEYLFEF
ncbi:MAG: IS200/IS605 family transposase [Sphingobacteriales bacterium JAD_PAG50586_3]|nr:MAG: IS200/IS605 family transposase [Sphingobacteriales bacterium JAD_PAG50586_3]